MAANGLNHIMGSQTLGFVNNKESVAHSVIAILEEILEIEEYRAGKAIFQVERT